MAQKIGWCPHFTSVINWMHRLGLGLLNQVKKTNREWIAIVDHSIGVGTKKALVVLRVSVDALYERGGAVRLEDCECVGLSVSKSVNREDTAAALEKIFAVSGEPVGIIKDCDASLNKAVRLTSEQHGSAICAIDDIGHALACGLKADYEKQEEFKDFIALAAKGAKYLYQTDLACFVPPKLRTKGRFQSISSLGKWALKMLRMLSIESEAENDNELEKLYEAFHGLEQFTSCINSFSDACEVSNQVMKILKNEGLNQSTYAQCFALSHKLTESPKLKKRLQEWLKKHIIEVQKFTNLPSLVSSDIIESLFGQYKYIISKGSCGEINRSALIIASMCGNQSDGEIIQALAETTTKSVDNWAAAEIGQTINQKRREFSEKYAA